MKVRETGSPRKQWREHGRGEGNKERAGCLPLRKQTGVLKVAKKKAHLIEASQAGASAEH